MADHASPCSRRWRTSAPRRCVLPDRPAAATYHPDILRQVAAAGHTIGAHTWSHAHLASEEAHRAAGRDEIEKGFSAVKLALGTNPAPFFRFPALAHTPATTAYLGTRNIAMFSVDVDSNDFQVEELGRSDQQCG